MSNKLGIAAYIVVDKLTGTPAQWCIVKGNAGLAKRNYSNNRQKEHQYPNQTKDVCVQLINPIALQQLLEGCKGNGMSGDDLIELIQSELAK